MLEQLTTLFLLAEVREYYYIVENMCRFRSFL